MNARPQSPPKLDEARIFPRALAAERPPWFEEEYECFFRLICTPAAPFPCFFAGEAAKRGELAYAWLSSESLEAPGQLATALTEFLASARYRSNRAGLIVFCKLPPDAQHEAAFWHLLQSLHEADPLPWLERIPHGPDDSRWGFCFRGEELFINAHSSRHVARRSRNAHCDLMLVIQRSTNFRDLVGADGPTKVQQRIRDAVVAYDAMPAHPSLLVPFADPECRAWKQYWLPDDNEPVTGRCPLHIHEKRDSK